MPNTVAFIAKVGAAYACIIDGAQVAKSKDQDYFMYHHKKSDIKALKRDIAQFVYLDEAGHIKHIADANVVTPDLELRRQAAAAAKLAAAH